MNSSRANLFRGTLALAAGVPVILVGVLPMVVSAGESAGLYWGLVAVLLAAAVAASLLLTRPLGRLAAAADGYARGSVGAELPPVTGMAADFSEALELLEGRRQHLADQLAQAQVAFERCGQAMHQLTADSTTLPTLVAESPFPLVNQSLGGTFDALAKAVRAARQQATTMRQILQEVPAAVIVTDVRGSIRMMNTAGERLFRQTRTDWANKPLSTLLTPAQRNGHAPTGVPVLDWLSLSGHGEIEVTAHDRSGRHFPMELLSNDANTAKNSNAVVLMGRELTRRKTAEANRIAQEREREIKSLSNRMLREATKPLHDVQNLAKFLIQESKQLGYRDRLLPKLKQVLDHTKRQAAFVDSLQWLYLAIWGGLPEQNPSEFMAVEAIREAQDKLAPRLAERNNILRIQDEGGWILCDADYLNALLVGVLTHANDSVKGSTIELSLERRYGDAAAPTDHLLISIRDAGPALTPEQLDQLRRPFEGPQGITVDEYTSGGFPLGLLLAGRLAAAMEGRITLSSDASNQLEVTLELPTRLSRHVEAGPEEPITSSAPEEETCGGWRLGYAN
ncbi:ATP-binding protein [Tuwongella immobilis]|uniref:histidine kinase n=1 Tax=Tuwongella immobilis TaxID=692036 RepID=A0A6C2YIS8_9BACT|nr:ATP-binding protein [Tuwongella immobilis]VIP01440.1 hybrid histidine kinase : PAS domain S-box OS=Thioploca ingrica GN=THII_0751 PE=4 SV=1: PAS: HATPase_c [Tuwongella immobilis]VTR98412.1 hybrid histidine kinase : PAS domain S-box OS=Thioploca ingrica GN=THII_0751 PE=4 SV=1: PAS: HATPase_c [Tuwongella immobilis]